MRSQFFISLHHRNYPYFILATIFSSLSKRLWMMLMGWFVLEFTDSPLLLAAVFGIRVVPMMFIGAVSGVFADRFDRRKIIIITQIGYLITSIALGTSIYLGSIQYSHFIVVVLVWGVFNTFNSTARQAFITDIVGKGDTINAVGLEMAVMTITSIIGSPFLGLLIEWMGVSWCYYLAAAFYGSQAIIFFVMRGVTQVYTRRSETATRSLLDGLKYVRSVQTLLAISVSAFIWNLLILPFSISFMSVYARDVLGIGATGLGMLNSAESTGQLVASIIIANLREFKHKGLLVIISTEMQALFLILFSLSRSLPLSLLLMVCAGAMASFYGSTTRTLLLTVSSEEMRGRVMGVRMQAISGEPPGNLWAGKAAEVIGVLPALWVGVTIYSILTLALAVLAPKLKEEP